MKAKRNKGIKASSMKIIPQERIREPSGSIMKNPRLMAIKNIEEEGGLKGLKIKRLL
jgi:hypothetical protein